MPDVSTLMVNVVVDPTAVMIAEVPSSGVVAKADAADITKKWLGRKRQVGRRAFVMKLYFVRPMDSFSATARYDSSEWWPM